MDNWFGPRHRVDVKDMQITQATATHTPVHDELWTGAISAVRDGCVRLARRRRLTVRHW